jgi:pyruvate,water dikinase
MEELLDLGRASYRLRDDDNIYFGMIENQLRLAIEESKGRLAHRGNIEVDGLDPMEVINALNDPDYMPKTATVTKVEALGSLIVYRTCLILKPEKSWSATRLTPT